MAFEISRKISIRRVALALSLCLLSLLVAAEVAKNIGAYDLARRVGRWSSNLEITPTDSRDQTLAALSTPPIERFGFSVRLPWQDIDHEMKGRTIDLVHFKDGVGVLLMDPADQPQSPADMARSQPSYRAFLMKLYGPSVLESNYALLSASLDTTPDQARWWKSRTRNVEVFELLAQKSIEMSDCETVRRISGGAVRGYQFDDPKNKEIKLILFDPKDRRYEIRITYKAPIAQSQINAIVASLYFLPKNAPESVPAATVGAKINP